MHHYSPNVNEGIYPEDAGWSKDNETNVLLLSIPMLSTIVRKKIHKFDYTWLYNEEMDAYIFCFRLQSDQEFAIIFQKEHAGRLLMDQEANGEFSILITDRSFDEINEDSPFVILPKILLNRQSIAGW